jgi:hypothetical protein
MMSCDFIISKDNFYIELIIKGDVTRELSMKYNIEAHKMGKEASINKYLVDLTESKNIDSLISNYQFAYNDMRLIPSIDRFASVAMVVSTEDHSHDFIEVVARNSGLDVKLFRDRNEAIRHLYND